MPNPLPRHARLVLVTPDGQLLGALPPLRVETPWWQEAWPVVRAARARHGIEVVVLRLLDAEQPVPQGGAVTYLAETASPPPAGLEPASLELVDHPLRQPWARPGGPDADLAWVDEVLGDRGMRRVAPAEQIRSWNLSSLWRVPVDGSTVWLKHVPRFFAHEGAILARLAGGPVPALLAHAGGRVLMPEIPGDDLYDAPLPILERLVSLLVGLQAEWIGREGELLALGLPDWREPEITRLIVDVVERTPEVNGVDRATLDAFVDDLPRRFAAIAEGGIPDTLVHGDFHPGNARGDERSVVLLDWGDSGVGHPLLDQAAYLDRVPPEHVPRLRALWHRTWREALPGSDPDRIARLLAPVAAARQAVIYRMFLDGIEPSEHPYHERDPADWLGRTAALVRAEA